MISFERAWRWECVQLQRRPRNAGIRVRESRARINQYEAAGMIVLNFIHLRMVRVEAGGI